MTPMQRYPFLRDLFEPFDPRNGRSMALTIAAIATTGEARSFAIATTMSVWLGTQLQSAINRFYRLLRNAHIDEIRLISQWAKSLSRGGSKNLLISIDWTEWPHNLRLLVAAVVLGKRAIPLAVRGFPKEVAVRSQNTRENDFLKVLAAGLHAIGYSATLLCDRGFRRVSWLKLIHQHRLKFVVRLMDDVHVTLGKEQVQLRDIQLAPGKIRDLGTVALRTDGKVSFRVVGFHARGQKQAWWVATNLEDAPSFILSLYDRRMTIEEQFRDLKGKRFGAKLVWTQFRDPQQLARFLLLLAIALLIWLIEGKEAAQRNPKLLLTCKRKGPRQSWVTIGLRLLRLRVAQFTFSAQELAAAIPAPNFRKIYGTARGGK